MLTRFTASQSVHIPLAEQPIPIQHYLRQPQRLVYALFDPNRVEILGQDRFRLTVRPLSFMMLNVQPTVDLQVRATADGSVYLQSTSCEIRGIEYINQRFNLDLQGRLIPEEAVNGTLCLRGRADLQVCVELPPALWLTPKPLLEKTGNSLLRGVLLTIKQRLMNHLLQDYYRWVSDQMEASEQRDRAQSSVLSTQSIQG